MSKQRVAVHEGSSIDVATMKISEQQLLANSGTHR